MKKGRWKFVIPTMVIVAIGAMFMLFNYYQEVPSLHKALIVISATIFSGILSHGMFANHDEDDSHHKEVQGQKTVVQKKKSK